jgi:hypothetical protein
MGAWVTQAVLWKQAGQGARHVNQACLEVWQVRVVVCCKLKSFPGMWEPTSRLRLRMLLQVKGTHTEVPHLGWWSSRTVRWSPTVVAGEASHQVNKVHARHRLAGGHVQ